MPVLDIKKLKEASSSPENYSTQDYESVLECQNGDTTITIEAKSSDIRQNNNNTNYTSVMLCITIVLGIFLAWLFCKFAKRDSIEWNKSCESRGIAITRYVLMFILGLYVFLPLFIIILGWNVIQEKEMAFYAGDFMLGISLFLY